MICEACGQDKAIDVSGRPGRIAWLKGLYQTLGEGERRKGLAERILDAIDEIPRLRCTTCVVCGYCGLTDKGLAPCDICGGLACADCSLPALMTDRRGKIVPESDNGRVLCARCNPPHGGSNACPSWAPDPQPNGALVPV